jgi:hypothetical protein
MRWLEVYVILAKVLYYLLVPLIYLFFLVWTWVELSLCQQRMGVVIMILLTFRFENTLAWVRLFSKSSAYEFETLVLTSLIYLLNTMEETCDGDTNSAFGVFNKVLFYFFLLANVSYYAYSFLVIMIFGLVILFFILRGDNDRPEFNLDTRGLRRRELEKLLEAKYGSMKRSDDENQSVDNTCSICLSELLNDEMAMKMPSCGHIFHSTCIKEWLMRQHICPFCRNNIRQFLKSNPSFNANN